MDTLVDHIQKAVPSLKKKKKSGVGDGQKVLFSDEKLKKAIFKGKKMTLVIKLLVFFLKKPLLCMWYRTVSWLACFVNIFDGKRPIPLIIRITKNPTLGVRERDLPAFLNICMQMQTGVKRELSHRSLEKSEGSQSPAQCPEGTEVPPGELVVSELPRQQLSLAVDAGIGP